MPKKFFYKQLTPAELGIISPGVVIPITKLRMKLDDGTKVEVLPPGGKAAFDDGDEIDIDLILPPGKTGKNKRLERHMVKDPRFTTVKKANP